METKKSKNTRITRLHRKIEILEKKCMDKEDECEETIRCEGKKRREKIRKVKKECQQKLEDYKDEWNTDIDNMKEVERNMQRELEIGKKARREAEEKLESETDRLIAEIEREREMRLQREVQMEAEMEDKKQECQREKAQRIRSEEEVERLKLEQEMGKGDTAEVEKLREELRKERIAKREAESRMNAAEREVLKGRARVAEEMVKVKEERTELDKLKKEANSFRKKWEEGEKTIASLKKMQEMLERQVRLGERTRKLLREDLAECACRGRDRVKGDEVKIPELKGRIDILKEDLKARKGRDQVVPVPSLSTEDIDMACEETVLLV